MNVYLAGNTNHAWEDERIFAQHPYRLYSFAYKKELRVEKEKLEELGANLFFDSGGYTAHTLGMEIKLDEYIEWIKSYEPAIYAVHDEIGNEKVTWERQKEMEANGMAPWIVWHVGSSKESLYRILDNYEEFAVGGMVGKRKPYLNYQLGQVFSAATEAHRIHGFGLTSFPLLKKFQFASVDSSTAIKDAALGRCWFWFGPERIVEVQFSKKAEGHLDFRRLQGRRKEDVAHYLLEECSIADMNSLVEDYYERRWINCVFYFKLQEYLQKLNRKPVFNRQGFGIV